MRRKRALTLVDLLLTLVILAALAAILVPVLMSTSRVSVTVRLAQPEYGSVDDIVRAHASLEDVEKISSGLEYLEISVALYIEQLALLQAVNDVPSAEANKARYHSWYRKQRALAEKTKHYGQLSCDGEEAVRAGRMSRKLTALTQQVPQERRRVEKIPGLPEDFWAPPYEGPVKRGFSD